MSRKISSNNPFASALNEPDSYVHRRDPPPPPSTNSRNQTPPSRPNLPPPSYSEVAGRKNSKEYPKEKEPSSISNSSSKPHRSHSDSNRRHRDDKHYRSREERHRHREERHRSSRNKSPKKPEAVKAKNMDTIDKLDVTAFFGGGFHHDGPFDACTPHRNKNAKQAPVMAFPADGPNNSIKGSAPNMSKNEQMDLAFGKYGEGDNLSSGRKGYKSEPEPVPKTNKISEDATTTLYTPKLNPSVINFDANKVAEPIHGSTTAGLGSSTFLDGAPAPKITNDEYLSTSGGGLGRKKSLVQRLRKNSQSEQNSRRNSNDNSVGTTSPPARSSFGDDEIYGSNGGGNSLLRRVKSLKVGGKR